MDDAFEEDVTFMHKGVECHFTKTANSVVSTDEDKSEFLDNFFGYEPMNSIHWVTVEEVEAMRITKPETALPMYSIKNRKGDTLLIWPMLAESNLHLYIETLVERPDLLGELKLERG
jgi:hypothetical protein